MSIINNKAFLFFILLAVTTVIYWPGLSGGFYFDDEWNILQNSSLQIEQFSPSTLGIAANSGQAGPLGRPIAMVSLAINYFFSGLDPFFFKITNLAIHLLTGLGVFYFSLGLVRQLGALNKRNGEWLALLVTAFWLIHPLNLSPVLYVVQRMTSLAALFCFWGLACYVYGRTRLLVGKSHAYLLTISAFVVFLPLGLLSKENAALFPLFCFLIELVFFQFKTVDRRAKQFLIILFLAVLAVPLVLVFVYTLIKPEWVLSSYVVREFDLTERLMTESRVLVFYLKEVVLPLNSELGLFHDDIVLSDSILSPISTLFSLLLILALLLSSVFAMKRFPVYAFGVLFFFGAHLIESTVIGLELVHEHRNYIASFSVLFFVAYCLVLPVNNALWGKIKNGLICVVLFYLAVTTNIRANIWGNTNLHTFEELRNHPASPRINYQVGKLFSVHAHEQEDTSRKKQYLDKASFYFRKSADLNESYTDGLFGLMMLQGIEGKKMRPEYRNQLFERLAYGPFNLNNYNYLAAYFKCIGDDVCTVDANEVDKLIASCEKNRGFRGKHRKNILRFYAYFQKRLES